MYEELKNISLSLLKMNATLHDQTIAINELKSQINELINNSKPDEVSVIIEPDCDYEWIWTRIQLDSTTWSRIKSGEHLTLKGKGWVPEDTTKPDPLDKNFHWDYWEFNGGINQAMKVTMVSPHESPDEDDDNIAFEGLLLNSFILVIGSN